MSDDETADVRPQIVRTTGKTLRTLIWGVVWIYIAFYVLRSIQALAGESTFAFIDVTTNLFGGMSPLNIVWWCVLLAGYIWAGVERSLRKIR